MGKTGIEWCRNLDGTPGNVWNVVTGCTKVSAGCRNCYAQALHDMRYRAYLEGKKVPKCYWTRFEEVTMHPEKLEEPLHWKQPRRVFVDSMGDLFHEDVPFEFIDQVFAAMFDAGRHTFMILTKRPERMAWYLSPENPRYSAYQVSRRTTGGAGKFDCDLYWPLRNVWVGVSIENQKEADNRLPFLLQAEAAVRFVSCEPLLERVNLITLQIDSNKQEMRKFDWVIAGGESGPGARPMHPDWARWLREQCEVAGMPFFFKQWGEWTSTYPQGINLANIGLRYEYGETFYRVGKKAAGRELDGQVWNEYPET